MRAQAMYNPALFSFRQELHMAAKKAASKRRKKTKTSRRKVTARKKAVAKRKVTRKSATTAKKKLRKKKTTKKKAAKKTAKRKATKRKSMTRKVSRKKSPATKKKTAKKKVAARKKTPNRASTRRARPRGDVLTGPIHGISPYKPRRGEEYMSPTQLEHFREILNAWKRELMFEVDRTVHHMQDEAANFPDPNDRATQESEFGLELRTRDRERKLLRKIDSAIARIDDGSYGYCEETGEEIGLKRLEARPVATLCLEAQERRELAERQFRDRDDRYR